MRVKPKKYLGQHFLKDISIAKKIADTLTLEGYDIVLEIGPGMGVLTNYIIQKPLETHLIEIDNESVLYLKTHFPKLSSRIYQEDVLKCNFLALFGNKPFAMIGNYPYNISSQIVFRMLDFRHQIPEFSGMFQKEVARRICEQPGSKTYGILSVLVQAFYRAEYLFTVPPSVFDPPPKVNSGVLRLIRKSNFRLSCDETLFFSVVKMAFQQRRKTLRNSLKALNLSDNLKANTIFDKRPEQLSVESFIELTTAIAEDFKGKLT